jgi:spore germination cell wall hydrolase CwlJ-like protein
MTDKDIFVYASTIWGEARGETLEGMAGVAHVIQNRKRRNAWPDTVLEVCLQPKQFSVWNTGDPNFKKVITRDLDDPSFWMAMYVALGVILGQIEDPTEGADHYHNKNIKPSWADAYSPTVTIKNHIFYNSED